MPKKPEPLPEPEPTLRQLYDGMPDPVKDQVMYLLNDALVQRDRIGHCTSNADGFMRQIAAAFETGGVVIEALP